MTFSLACLFVPFQLCVSCKKLKNFTQQSYNTHMKLNTQCFEFKKKTQKRLNIKRKLVLKKLMVVCLCAAQL